MCKFSILSHHLISHSLTFSLRHLIKFCRSETWTNETIIHLCTVTTIAMVLFASLHSSSLIHPSVSTNPCSRSFFFFFFTPRSYLISFLSSFAFTSASNYYFRLATQINDPFTWRAKYNEFIAREKLRGCAGLRGDGWAIKAFLTVHFINSQRNEHSMMQTWV